VEQHHDENGIIMPASIAPFAVVVTPVNNSNAEQMTAATALYRELLQRNVDVLLDDRDERPGVKFKDADLIGIPYRITVGKKIGQGVVELSERRSKQSTDLPLSGVADEVVQRLQQTA
jgi:prolyl-tRNA synthetase